MRVFLRRLLFFIAPLAVLLLFFEWFLREMDTTYKIKARQLGAAADKIQVLILGNSHAAIGLDPRQFSMYAFNLAQVGQSLYFDKRVTLKYIDRLKGLKYVLISVDFHSLYFSNEDYRNLWSYYGYGVEYKNKTPLLSKYSYLHGYKPTLLLEFLQRAVSKKYRIARALDVESEANMDEPFVKGFSPYKERPALEDDKIRMRAAYFNDIVRNPGEHNEILADLEDFLVQLKKRNITPILFTMPCYGPFRELLDKKVQEQNEADISYLTEKYQIPYWDYFAYPIIPDYYCNCDHLNDKGAAVFSAVINQRIEAFSGGK